MRVSLLLTILALHAVAAAPVVQDAAGEDWPREIEAGGHKIVIYQPQLDSIEGDVIVGRCAVSVKKGEGEPSFGVVWVKAHMVTDRNAREVTFTNIDVTRVKASEGKEAASEPLEKLLEDEIPKWGLKTSMDRIVAAQELLEKEKTATDNLKVDPPEMVWRTKPAALVNIDGEPIVAATPDGALKRVMNTALFLVQDGAKYYLFLGDRWAEAPDLLKGPWMSSKPPAAVTKAADADAVAQAQAKAAKESKEEKAPGIPEIIVATKPTELLVSKGDAEWASIAGTNLLYISNTSAEVFREVKSQKFFVLMSGRWYASESQTGPWKFVAADKLPEDFQKIPPGHEMADVRASVAGTPEAQEAVLDARMPQTAAVKRSDAKVEVTYDGEPKFEKVEGIDVQYAVNTPFAVFLVNGRYYCCHNATWFESPTPKGPWGICTKVPPEIYELPPSNPHYNVKYVYVYEATPEYVYVGYTSGYCGCYLYGPTVIYGTGWWYRGWWGGWYYPRPCTWGVGVRYSCVTGNWAVGIHVGNPWWGVSIGWTSRGGGWVAVGAGGCIGWTAWRGNADIDININHNDINIDNTNLYNRRQDAQNRVANRETKPLADRRASGTKNDVFADRDGNVYRKQQDGWEKRDSASRDWKRDQAASAEMRRQLDSANQARQRGTQRAQQGSAYRSGGGGGGGRRGGGGGGRR